MKRLALAGLVLCVVVLVTRVFAYPTLNSFLTVYNVTSSETLTELHSGRIIHNAGAGGPLTLTLPPAATGLHIIVSLSVGVDVNVDPQTGDQILALTNAAGDAISSDVTVGSTVELVAIDATNWLLISRIGTWSDVN